MPKILAIDDRPENLNLVSKMLRQLIPGCTVLTAQTGHLGLELAGAERPDVILLDIQMPGMDGYEVCQQLKSDSATRNIPVLFLTGVETDTVSRIKGLEIGGDAFLTKPVRSAELAAQVKAMLRLKRAEDDLRRQQQDLEELVEERTRELKASENLARVLLNAPTDAAIIIEPDGTIVDLNDTTANRFNRKISDLRGTLLWDLFPSMVIERRKAKVNLVIQTGRPVRFEDERQGMWNDHVYYPIFDESGNVIQVAMIARDITERKEAEKTARVQQEQLMQAAKMAALGTLVSGVAHEINNPNTFVMLNAPTILKVWDSVTPILDEHARQNGDFDLGNVRYSEIREDMPFLIKDILDGSRRIKRIVEDLKDFARPDDAELLEPVSVTKVVQSSLNLLHNLIRKSTKRFSMDLADNLPATLGNPQRLGQVIINLIQNACEALTDPNQAVSISAGYDEATDCVVIEVQDEGQGIPQDLLPQITDPFFTTKRNSGGTGLGLSVSSTIVREHGGSLSFTSDYGNGTVARVSLPIRRPKSNPRV